MPEEELKNDFTDLPNPDEKPPVPPVEGKEEKPNDDMAKLLVEKERMAQEEREKRKAEVKKRKELEAEIERLKQKPPEEEEDEEEEKPPVDKRSIQETVKQTIHEESYNKEINQHIRAVPGITRPLAEELDRTVKLLPKSNDPEADVRAAMAYLNARNATMFNPPVVNAGFGGFSTTKTPVSPTAVKLGEVYGLKADDFNKYSGEVKL